MKNQLKPGQSYENKYYKESIARLWFTNLIPALVKYMPLITTLGRQRQAIRITVTVILVINSIRHPKPL